VNVGPRRPASVSDRRPAPFRESGRHKQEKQVSATPSYGEINRAKSDFESIYNRPDPRAYFAHLGGVDYQIPQNAKPVFERVIDALRRTHKTDAVNVVDLGCSYGVNAALLKYGMDLDDLYARYASPEAKRLDRDELLQEDLRLIEEIETEDAGLKVVGLDVAPEAVGYATDAGLLDAGIVADLEGGPLAPEDAAALCDVDLVISTGCVGYVTERSFARIVGAADGEPLPWIASFVLRMFPYDRIADTLDRHGYRTEKLDGVTFVQRRFANDDERRDVLAILDRMGIDPRHREAEGRYHADFFLSRPEEEAAAAPLAEIVDPVVAAPREVGHGIVSSGLSR
jgi:SAM-dependent methyltransferase